MFYVKTASDGSLLQYPYTLADLRLQNKSTSWPIQISDEVAAEFGVFPVTPAPQPADNYTINLERIAVKQGNEWLEQWIETPATPEQITERTNTKAAEVRSNRNRLLADCDWTQLPDAPVDAEAWATYRQELRDVTAQSGFPWNVQWPEAPNLN
jgi:hypothetical protein